MNLQTDLFLDPPLGDFTGSTSLEEHEVNTFREYIYSYYGDHGRDFPWRDTFDPYEILVSEIMLQQTQTQRVLGKYRRFLNLWPDFYSLSNASLADVYREWSGLGYNRRAKALRDIARIVVNELNGELPNDPEALTALPMIGNATAAAICAFAFGTPAVYLETNIRRVYIYFFFEGRSDVHDREILPLASVALDAGDPRQWYYALMDYGVYLKSRLPNPNRRSVHYARQSPFDGSDRQIRGGILKRLAELNGAPVEELAQELPFDNVRIEKCLNDLEKEGFLVCEEAVYRISD
jgi:A/G-specific adenine glycosylase